MSCIWIYRLWDALENMGTLHWNDLVKLHRTFFAPIQRSASFFMNFPPAGSNHHTEWAAWSDWVHLFRQDRNSDTEHHAVQEVHHCWTELWYWAASFRTTVVSKSMAVLIRSSALAQWNLHARNSKITCEVNWTNAGQKSVRGSWGGKEKSKSVTPAAF